MKNIVIFGASGHAKMIVDIVHSTGQYNIIGFVDTYKEPNKMVYGYPILGNAERIPKLMETQHVEGIVVAIGDNYTRKQVCEKIKNELPNLEFVRIIHKSAIVAKGVSIGAGTVIMANVVVNADAEIGESCILNTASILGHDSIMGNFSSLASRATVAGNVAIGSCSAICLSASIIQNVSVGDHTVIGAGSLVLKSIGDFKQATGSPIDRIKDRNADSKYLGPRR